MLQITAKHKIFIAVQAIDFRCGIDGLAGLCRRQWQLDPMSGHFFIFRNRKGNAIKIITYDSQGYVLCQKRLSAKTFNHWPRAQQSLMTLTPAQLQVLFYNGDPTTVVTAPPWRTIES
jgi:transposase